MSRLIAVAVALAFSAGAQAQSTTDKIKEAAEANTKAVNEKRAKDRAEADAREKANKEAREKNKGVPSVPASVKKTAEGIDKKRSEDKSPAPKR